MFVLLLLDFCCFSCTSSSCRPYSEF